MFKSAVRRAKSYGCEIELVRQKISTRTRTKRFLANGRLCNLHDLKKAFRFGRDKRWSANMAFLLPTLLKVEWLIVRVQVAGFPEHWFVIPSLKLQKLFAGSNSKRKNFRFPLEKLPVYHNRLPMIDYWQYEDAWHLIKKEAGRRKTAETQSTSVS